ncbi:MAG: phosphate signaling complex protein PhoU [Agathobacter sp.]|nr:phosphate signaling complex protein PhoU [Agathobacter sp.]MDY3795275.1 phosphate signaling complex protein PhoU [Agathobacter sp.]
MRAKFDEQLNQLNQEMVQMGVMIEENIQTSIEALVRHNVEMAKEIVEKDVAVDQKQKQIEGICFDLLIQQQPVAKDLRAITAAMKMVTDMERIGDHAADISEITVLLDNAEKTKSMETIIQMASEALFMLMQSIDAYVKKDIELAQKVIQHDDVVDKLFGQIKQEIIEQIQQNKEVKEGEYEIDMLMIAKYLERIGDHATNIAEWVIYAYKTSI